MSCASPSTRLCFQWCSMGSRHSWHSCCKWCARCSVPFHFVLSADTITFRCGFRWFAEHTQNEKGTKTTNTHTHKKSIQSKSVVCLPPLRFTLLYVPRSFCFLIITIERVHLQYLCNLSNAIMHYDRADDDGDDAAAATNHIAFFML